MTRLIGMRRLRLFVAAAASIAVLASCGNGGDDTTAVPEDSGAGSQTGADDAATGALLDTYWGVDGVDVADVSVRTPTDTSAYVLIEKDSVEGTTGCNSFGGDATVSEDSSTVTFSNVFATKRACAGDVGKLDTAMLSILRDEVTAEVNGDVLTLTNADGGTLELKAMKEPPS